MSFQGAMLDLMKVFLGFYLACYAVGRADIPFRLVTQLQVAAMDGASNTRSWGCPSISPRKGDCLTWRAEAYK